MSDVHTAHEVARWRFDPNGLTVLCDDLTRDEMQIIAATAPNLENAGTWGKYDAILYAESLYGEEYPQFFDMAQYNPGTLANALSINRFWRKEQRIYAVSWSHYNLVTRLARLDFERAADLLEQAEAEKWKRGELIAARKRELCDCPKCRESMLRTVANGVALWVCQNRECEHTLPYSEAPTVETVRAESVAEIDGDYIVTRTHRDHLPGVQAGDTVYLRAKVEVPALRVVATGQRTAAEAA